MFRERKCTVLLYSAYSRVKELKSWFLETPEIVTVQESVSNGKML